MNVSANMFKKFNFAQDGTNVGDRQTSMFTPKNECISKIGNFVLLLFSIISQKKKNLNS